MKTEKEIRQRLEKLETMTTIEKPEGDTRTFTSVLIEANQFEAAINTLKWILDEEIE